MSKSLFRGLVAVILLVSIPGSAMAQRLGGGTAPEFPVVRIILALLACLAIGLLAILFLRHRSGAALSPSLRKLLQSQGTIEVLETRRLSVQHSLCLVRHGGKEYLLVLSPSDTLVLNEQASPTDSTAEPSA